MAKLPDVTSLGSRPVPRPGGMPNVPMPQSSGVAEAVSSFSDTMAKIKEYDDKLQAEDAQNRLQQRTIELRNGDNGFSRLKSGDVANRPVYKEYDDQFTEAVNEISGSLTNDYQRKLFQQRANVVRIQYGNDLTNHIMKEKEAYFQQTVESGIALEVQNAGEHWNEPGSIKLSVARTHHLIDLKADKDGLPFAARKALKLQATSKIHSTAIDQAIANENALYAKQYFENNKKDIDATKHDDITKLIRNTELRVLSQTVADEIMPQNLEEKDALEKVRKQYKGEEEKAIVDAIKARYTEQRDAKKQSEISATDEAWNYYNNAVDAGSADPYGQIPLNLLNEMDPQSRATLKAKSQGADFKSGGADYYALRMLAMTDPKSFRDPRKTNILSYKLSDADAKELIKLQTDPQEIDYFDTELSIVNSGLRAIKVDKKDLDKDNSDGQRGRAFMNEVRRRQKAYQLAAGKPMDEDKLMETVDKMTIEIARKAKPLFGETIHDWTNPDFLPAWMTEPMGSEKTPAFEAEIEGIPNEMVQELAKSIRDSGQPVTTENIKKLYYGSAKR